MAVTAVGTPSTPTQTTSGTGALNRAGAWSGTQPRTADDLLVALFIACGTTTASASSQTAGTTGWTKLAEWGAATPACASIWTKPATGGDAAPSFTSTIVGTSARTRLATGLWQLNSGNGSVPLTDVYNSGAGTGTSATLTTTTVGNVAAAGEYALAVQANYGSTGTCTWGTSGSFTNSFTDAASTYAHWVMAILASPASGATLSYAPTHSSTSTAESGVVAVFKAGAPVIRAGLAAGSGAASRPAVVTDETSPGLELSGYGAFPGVEASDTINSITVTSNQFVSNTLMGPPTYELWDGATAKIGTTRTGTATTADTNIDSFVFTGVTYAQLSTLRVRIYGHKGTAPAGAVQNVNWTGLTLNYSPAAGGASVSASAGAASGLAGGQGTWATPANAAGDPDGTYTTWAVP